MGTGEGCSRGVDGLYGGTLTGGLLRAGPARPGEITLNLRLSSSGRPFAWGLELAIPLGDCDTGQVSIDVGGREGLLNCGATRGGVGRLSAEPAVDDYSVLSISPEAGKLGLTLERTCRALSTTHAAAFEASEILADRPLPRCLSLSWGHAYVFVWHSSQPIQVPQELDPEFLQPNEEWLAAVLYMPQFPNSFIEQWVARQTALPISVPEYQIDLIWPASARSITGGYATATAGTPILCFVRRAPATDATAPAVLYVDYGGERRAAGISNVDEPFFQVSSDWKGALQLTYKEDRSARLTVEGRRPTALRPTSVVFSGVLPNGQDTKVELLDENASVWFEDVRDATLVLNAVEIPNGVRGSVSVHEAGEWKEVLQLLPDKRVVDGGFKYGPPHSSSTEKLSSILRDKSQEVWIDFGAFGRVWLPGEGQKQARQSKLSKGLRHRLHAYIYQMKHDISSNELRRPVSDEELVQAVSRHSPSRQNEALHRVLVTELARSRKTSVNDLD